jgi:hypothetical protein
VPRENLPHPSGPDGSREPGLTRSTWSPGSAGEDDELTALRADPVMRWHAQRLAGDFAEDLLQQTWYAVARVRTRRSIVDLRAYFYTVMVRTAGRMREDIARQGIPADDPVTAAGPRRGRELAAAPAEDEALRNLATAALRELLRCRRTELRQVVPACSPDPDWYRDVIVGVAERMLADDGPDGRAEVNAALTAAYPEWFAAPDATDAARFQRRRRGRVDIGRVLKAVLGAC